MRHASMILFVVSAVIFLIGLGQAVMALKNAVGGSFIAGEPMSSGLVSFLMFLSGTFAAFGGAALPFLGAVAINRWDRRNG